MFEFLIVGSILAGLYWFTQKSTPEKNTYTYVDRNGIQWVFGSSQNVETGISVPSARPTRGYESVPAISRSVTAPSDSALPLAIDAFTAQHAP